MGQYHGNKDTKQWKDDVKIAVKKKKNVVFDQQKAKIAVCESKSKAFKDVFDKLDSKKEKGYM